MNTPAPSNRGPRLVVDQLTLYQLFGDPKFWKEVPAFAFMKRAGQEAVTRIQNDVLNRSAAQPCMNCSPLRSTMIPLLTIFGQHLAQLYWDNPAALDTLVDFISRRRKYRPSPIAVYYKDEQGKTSRIEL